MCPGNSSGGRVLYWEIPFHAGLYRAWFSVRCGNEQALRNRTHSESSLSSPFSAALTHLLYSLFPLQHHRARYWNEQHFAALAKVESVAEKHGLTLAEVALRWLSHHSLLKRELGDAVIIGASSVKHVEQNLVDLEKGPLREFLS